jgi:hypothetical protein
VKVEVNPDVLLAPVERAFRQVTEVDLPAEASRRAKRVTGRWADSMEGHVTRSDGDRLEGEFGSTVRSARAHEKGAFIQAKRAEWLAIPMPDGSMRKVKSVRIPARPAVIPAGATFSDAMSRRLREETGR